MCSLTPSDLQRIFEKLDMNGDGILSLEELNVLLEKTGFKFSIEELESLVGKQVLDFSEFLFFYDSMLKQNNEEEKETKGEGCVEIEEVEGDLVKAFKVFDLDGDGFITSHELECVLKRLGMWDECSGKDCRTMICSYDTNLDGKLDFQEFKDMMLLTTS
ncbi:probable calcium-binding protein CML44 [Abrus precatorius]|uniref:Probable calcium-binding protein CML44 n=1 Tax=Abrus precatorius TaxID=3816 RepID=A0A8B8JNM9_ABRPR|nr:probable calcium-binding protein CML44 [Abrus precatorius]